MLRMIRRALRRREERQVAWREQPRAPAAPEEPDDAVVVEGYYAGPGIGPFAVPVEPRETLHDGYGPIRRRRPDEGDAGERGLGDAA